MAFPTISWAGQQSSASAQASRLPHVPEKLEVMSCAVTRTCQSQ